MYHIFGRSPLIGSGKIKMNHIAPVFEVLVLIPIREREREMHINE
jgi:hypothetical protein